MSYILDALRKSEAERSRGEAPSLLTSAQFRRQTWSRWLLLALVVVLGANALVAGVWLLRPAWFNAASAHDPLRAPASAPAAVAESTPATLVAVPQPMPATVPAVVPDVADMTAIPSDQAESATSTPPADASAADVQPNATAPAIEISAHVYSEDPSLRSVTIDGRRLRQGDEIRPGLRLVEVTETGIVVEEGGLQSTIDVLQDWR